MEMYAGAETGDGDQLPRDGGGLVDTYDNPGEGRVLDRARGFAGTTGGA